MASARARAGSALARVAGAPSVVSTRLAERLQERRAARRRVALVRLGTAAAVAALLALLAWVVFASPLLALRADDVRVTSSGPAADPAQVAAVLAQHEGVPLARLRTGALEGTIAELVPGVRVADVRRAWPRGLAVDVEARVPVAAVPSGGRLALLDVDGVQVGDRVTQAPEGIPVLTIARSERTADALAAVLTVLSSVPPELLAEINDAGATSADTVRFRLADGTRVEWGSAELTDLKVRVLEVLRQRPASMYDVSAPTMPVTR